jgi:predicted RND superfamily exporter protein
MPRLSALESVLGKMVEAVIRYRIIVLCSLLVFVAGMIATLPRLRFDSAPDSFFMTGDPALTLYKQFREQFNSDTFVYIVMESPSPWSATFVKALRGLTQALRDIDGVIDATSLVNVRHIRPQEGMLMVGDYIPEEATAPAELHKRVAEATRHPYYRNLFISADGTYLGILVRTEIREGQSTYKHIMARRVRELLAQEPFAALHPRAVGSVILATQVQQIVTTESQLFGILVVVLFGLGLLWIFRSGVGVLLPLVVAGLSTCGTFAIMALLDAPFGLLSPIIPQFMISVGAAASVYLLTEIYQEVHEGLTIREAVSKSLRTTGVATGMSVFTTAGGILAFASSDIRPVQEVGLAMGLGLLLSFVLTVLLIPVWFSFVPAVRISAHRHRILQARVQFLVRTAEFIIRWRRTLLGGFAILIGIAIVGVTQLRSDYYYLGMFKRSTPIWKDNKAVEAALAGGTSIELVIKALDGGDIREPSTLKAMRELQAYMHQAYPTLSLKTYSIADVVCELNQALHDGNPAFYQIPDSPEAVAQLLLLFEMSGHDDLSQLVASDYSRGRIRVQINNYPDSYYLKLFEGIKAWEHQHFAQSAGATPAFAVQHTGVVHLSTVIHKYLMDTQLSSLSMTCLIVMTVMMIMFRSVILGMAMTMLNLMPVVVTLGGMGWLGIPLDPFTVLLSSIALGMLDDDTIHFVKRIQGEMAQGSTLEEAIRQAFASTGQAVFFLGLILAGAFAVYGFSVVASLTKFGLLTSFTIFVGAVMECLLTPSLLLVLPRRLWPNGTKTPTLSAGRPDATPSPAPI